MAMGRRGQGAAAGGGGAQLAYPVLAAAPRRMCVTGFRGARSRYGALLQGLTVAAVHVLRTSRGAPTRMVDGVRTRRDAPGRGPRCHCGTARPAIVALRAAATSAPRAHPRCRRAGAVKPCRSGAHGPAGARPGKGASEHGQANNDAWLNNDTWPRADGQVVGGRTGAARPRTRSRTMWPS
jgi:hypothetical protein